MQFVPPVTFLRIFTADGWHQNGNLWYEKRSEFRISHSFKFSRWRAFESGYISLKIIKFCSSSLFRASDVICELKNFFRIFHFIKFYRLFIDCFGTQCNRNWKSINFYWVLLIANQINWDKNRCSAMSCHQGYALNCLGFFSVNLPCTDLTSQRHKCIWEIIGGVMVQLTSQWYLPHRLNARFLMGSFNFRNYW